MGKLAIIPARSGSKRIPGKNIKNFLGKPIIAYAIEAAVSSGLFDEIMVSTDSEEIADLARLYGAEVPFLRSAKNSSDFATTMDVVQEVLEQYSELGMEFADACCIYATAVFTQKNLLLKGLELMKQGGFDTVFPAVAYNPPIQRSFGKNSDGQMVLREPEYKYSRSQDLEEFYHDAGLFYWMNVDRIRNMDSLWTKNTGLLIISENECHDIDSEYDWKLAEMKYKLLER